MESTKRKRSDNDTGGPPENEIVRSSEFWFDDGSVVLQVEDTQFCVHHSLLSRQSTVLADLFTIPQPQDGERVEGRPLVHLLDDKAKDWTHILGCLYNGLNLRSDMKEYFPQALVSMLRLGDKYLFDEIKSFAVRHLKQEFPVTFPHWITRTPRFSTERHLGYEIDIINIALELQMTSILPCLFYLFLKDREMNEIFDGTTRTDGSVAHLHPPTQRTLALGRTRILKAVMDFPLKWVNDCDDEHFDACCVDGQLWFLQKVAPSLSHDVSLALDFWQMQSEAKLAGFCPRCLGVAESRIKDGCRRLWNTLPSYFDLPTWAVLAQNPANSV